jgi:tetraacyldisaccharide 4'-kinase
LGRAHALVLTRCDQVEPALLDALAAELEELAPGRPVLRARHAARALRRAQGRQHPAALRGREVDLVSALGNPEAFERSVTALGARVGEHRRFPDHHAFAPADLAGLGMGGRWIVTSEKDAVKIAEPPPELTVLEIELEFDEGRNVLDALLEALPRSRASRERRGLHEGLHG